MSNLPSPVPTKTSTVPVDYSRGFHDPQRRTPSGPELRQPNPEASISRFQLRLGSLALKHNDLMSQSEDLHLKIGPTLKIRAKGSQQREQHREHGRRSLCVQGQ